MATLDSIDLGKIQSEQQTKDAGLFNTPLPYSDSIDSLIMDIFGTSKNITITGIFSGTTTSELVTFIGLIEGIVNGQQTGSTYVGDLITTSKTVLVQTFDWVYDKGNPLSISYTLTMIQGSVL